MLDRDLLRLYGIIRIGVSDDVRGAAEIPSKNCLIFILTTLEIWPETRVLLVGLFSQSLSLSGYPLSSAFVNPPIHIVCRSFLGPNATV